MDTLKDWLDLVEALSSMAAEPRLETEQES